MNNTLINSERFISTLHELRNIGSRKTGVVRQAFSTDDIRARHWLRDELTSIGLRVTIDAAGNVFGCPPDNCPCLLLGSHTDTQPQGGWLDGALGVVAALEVLQVGGGEAYPLRGPAQLGLQPTRIQKCGASRRRACSSWSGASRTPGAPPSIVVSGVSVARWPRRGTDLVGFPRSLELEPVAARPPEPSDI